MKAFVNPPPGLSRAMTRVANALIYTAPQYGVQIVSDPKFADFVVLHAIGYPDTLEAATNLACQGKRFGLIQYCVRSTQKPDTKGWMSLWDAAEIVWSYYDLVSMLKADKAPIDEMKNFYLSPLGVDPTFRPWPVPKKALIMTSGFVASSESLNEIAEAVQLCSGRMVHLGPNHFEPKLVGQVGYVHNVPDVMLSQAYARCQYVSGLRRDEGFELPAVEGLMSGSRPVFYDKPHYRLWFNDFAEFIEEGSYLEVRDQLVRLFQGPYRDVTSSEIEHARTIFDWNKVTGGFWERVAPRAVKKAAAVQSDKPKRSIIWCGDAVVSSGFARATHKILDAFKDEWDTKVVGINYLGEPHDYPYRIYPAISRSAPQDFFGIRQVAKLASYYSPDVVMLQNDPWNFPRYLKNLKDANVMGVVAVDGLNCRGKDLNGLSQAVFWTKFAEREARLGGYGGESTVIGLGVDLTVYRPTDGKAARRAALKPHTWDGFIVGNANRNQPRKRLDLTIRYFAKWVKEHDIPDAFLYLQVAPTGDQGFDCQQLANYYGIANRLILVEPEIGLGMSEEGLALTYGMWDLQVTTTQGEGWGLTTMEGMACGVPQIVPDWSALGEWARPAAMLVPCPTTAATPTNINTIGGVADEEKFIEALQAAYSNAELRAEMRQSGFDLVRRPEFRWENIAQKYLKAVVGRLNAS